MHINPATNFYGTNGAAIPVSAILDRIEINSTGRICDREFEVIPELPDFTASRRVSLALPPAHVCAKAMDGERA